MFEYNPERTEKAPATIVSLVGQNEYKQCAEDLYFFLQVNIPPVLPCFLVVRAQAQVLGLIV